jgi:hypothetical protein
LAHQEAILAVLRKSEAQPYIYNTLRDYCFDASFWLNLRELIHILLPLHEKLTIFEGDMYEMFFSLLSLDALAM